MGPSPTSCVAAVDNPMQNAIYGESNGRRDYWLAHGRCSGVPLSERWRAVSHAIVRAALIGSPSERVLVATIVGLLLVFFGPVMCTLRNPAPIGRTISGVKRRLDRDLPAGTSVDSAVAYLKRTGVHFDVTDPHQIEGWEDGVATEWPFEGDLIFKLYYDDAKRIRFDTVYAEVIAP
jgi:hypothetical protein